MDGTLHVLCYHRVLVDEGRREHMPYFLRGTAVSQEVFGQHVTDLREHFDCLDEERALAFLRGEIQTGRAACWVTFDDAYADVLEVAAPVLAAAGIPATLFVSTATLDGAVLPADRWYATVLAARRRLGTLNETEPWQFDLDDPGSLSRFIDGPEKRRFLRSDHREQTSILNRLATALDAASTIPGHNLYLGVDGVRQLEEQGWSVGSHSVSHAILTEVGERAQRRELEDSRAQLEQLLGQPPATFSYPDGAWDDQLASRVGEAGYMGAVTLVRREARPVDNIFTIPRLLATNDPCLIRSLVPQEGRRPRTN